MKGVPNDVFTKQLNDNLSTNFGFNLQIPIFNRLEVKNRVSSSKLAVENSKLEIENAKMGPEKKNSAGPSKCVGCTGPVHCG